MKYGIKVSERLLAALSKYPFLGKRVFIPGAGYGGLVSYLLEQKCKEIVALDTNTDAVNHLQQQFTGKESVRIVMEDIRNVDFDNLGKFELIVCNNLLHFFRSEIALEVITKFQTALNDGGKLIMGGFTNEDDMAQNNSNCFYPSEGVLEQLAGPNCSVEDLWFHTIQDMHPPHGRHEHKAFLLVLRKSRAK